MTDDAGMVYRAIAEELSVPGTALSDLDPEAVETARAYARRTKQKWPPRPRTSGIAMQIWSIPNE
jgi:hypothetical protein